MKNIDDRKDRPIAIWLPVSVDDGAYKTIKENVLKQGPECLSLSPQPYGNLNVLYRVCNVCVITGRSLCFKVRYFIQSYPILSSCSRTHHQSTGCLPFHHH